MKKIIKKYSRSLSKDREIPVSFDSQRRLKNSLNKDLDEITNQHFKVLINKSNIIDVASTQVREEHFKSLEVEDLDKLNISKFQVLINIYFILEVSRMKLNSKTR